LWSHRSQPGHARAAAARQELCLPPGPLFAGNQQCRFGPMGALMRRAGGDLHRRSHRVTTRLRIMLSCCVVVRRVRSSRRRSSQTLPGPARRTARSRKRKGRCPWGRAARPVPSAADVYPVAGAGGRHRLLRRFQSSFRAQLHGSLEYTPTTPRAGRRIRKGSALRYGFMQGGRGAHYGKVYVSVRRPGADVFRSSAGRGGGGA